MSDGSPGAPPRDVIMRPREGDSDSEEDEEEEHQPARRGTAADDSDEEEEAGSGSEAGEEMRGEWTNVEQPPAADDDDDDDDDEEETADASRSVTKAFDVLSIKEDYFLTYGKKTFGVPDHAFVIIGRPFSCKDGKWMGHTIASKSPEEWDDIKSRHIFVLQADGHDYMYVCFYVEGSETEAIDKRRLHPVHRPVCKGLVDRFGRSNITDERKMEIARIMNFQCPPEDCGPQINPLSVRWPRYQIEAGAVPTALEKRVSKPRALKSKGGKDAVVEPSAQTTPVAPKPAKSIKEMMAPPRAEAPAPPTPLPAAPPAPSKSEKKKRVGDSPRDDGSNASTAVAGSSSRADAKKSKVMPPHRPEQASMEWSTEGSPFVRLRSVDLEADPAKCHVYIMGNRAFIAEHA